ncbi:formate dehydrogenase accessory sulfurtransferase FdhD [Puia sp. P3]|uniref:formate dehydrogenase accessory sulfurtransferase FdhD n=1 Tax=Puia sp. P3 TaxID=3423952 RepID=UPI003D66F59E
MANLSTIPTVPTGDMASGVTLIPVQKITSQAAPVLITDAVAVEEPLEISLEYGPAAARRQQNVSVTMRTPGQDTDLAIGFLLTEAILPNAQAIKAITSGYNTIKVSLHENIAPDIDRLQRHFYTSSSCGVCGKSSIEALRTVAPATTGGKEAPPVEAHILHGLPPMLRQEQSIFETTGGLHAAALFNRTGMILSLREDIGRHNAVDKLIGRALQDNLLPLTNVILLLSGRACFELIQKAAMAGIKIIAAIGPLPAWPYSWPTNPISPWWDS